MLTVSILTAAAVAQQFDARTPDGALLNEIQLTADPAAKTSMMEQFLSTYPDHEQAGWVWEMLSTSYRDAGEPERALDACQEMLEHSPANAAGAHACLKIAESMEDSDLIVQWAGYTHDAAWKAVKAPGADPESVDFATQVGQYSEYDVYAQALKETDASRRIALHDRLVEMNPDSEYIDMLTPQMFVAYQQAGDSEKAAAAAEQYLQSQPDQEDAIEFLAFYNLNTTQDAGKTLEYAQRLVDLMSSKPAPDGVTADRWEAKKKQLTANGNWMIGITYATQGKLTEADKILRAALPNLENDSMRAAALFHLGVVNYKMAETVGGERVQDAYNFTKQCAAIASPFQEQASANLKAMEGKFRNLK